MAKRKTREEKQKMKGYNIRLGRTNGKFKTSLVAALRQEFHYTRRAQFIRDVRIKYIGPKPFKYTVSCVNCEKVMGHTEKFKPRKVDGTLSKRSTSVYQVDHINGLPSLEPFENLQEWVNELFYGALQVLCYKCHSDKTKKGKKK